MGAAMTLGTAETVTSTIEGFPTQAWLGIVGTLTAIVALTVVSIIRGKLIPEATHQREITAAATAVEKAEHDLNEWRAESRIKDAQLAEQNGQLHEKDRQLHEKDRQLRHMGEVGETMKRVLTALQGIATGNTHLPPELDPCTRPHASRHPEVER